MKHLVTAALAIGVLLTATGCNDQPAQTCQQTQTCQQNAQDQAAAAAASRQPYIPVNNVEFNNYNNRQKLADNPATIWWCTSAFPIPSSPLFTVPVLGKLTSSSKRPFASDPGPDGMYGSSVPYDYGFTPGGVYVQFSASMSVYCTTEPTVWTRQSTTIVVAPDAKLVAAQDECTKLLTVPAGKQPPAGAAAQCNALLIAAERIDKRLQNQGYISGG